MRETIGIKVEDDVEPQNPGEYQFMPNDSADYIAGIIFMCPCGCGEEGRIRFSNPSDPEREENYPTWTWNGDKDNPSLTPSIDRKNTCGWHGYLTNGVFKGC